MKTTLLLSLILALGGALALPAVAQDADETVVTTRELVDQRLAEMQERLALPDYTWDQVHLILKTSIRERIAIARKYGLDGSSEALGELSGKDKRAMRRELKDSRKATEDRMERYLDKDQMKEFEAVQKEVYEEMLARMEAREAQLAGTGSSLD